MWEKSPSIQCRYFLFLFELLKFFPGQIEWVGTFLLPTIAILALFLLPFYDRSPFRHWKKRKFAVTLMSVIVVGIIALKDLQELISLKLQIESPGRGTRSP